MVKAERRFLAQKNYIMFNSDQFPNLLLCRDIQRAVLVQKKGDGGYVGGRKEWHEARAT